MTTFKVHITVNFHDNIRTSPYKKKFKKITNSRQVTMAMSIWQKYDEKEDAIIKREATILFSKFDVQEKGE